MNEMLMMRATTLTEKRFEARLYVCKWPVVGQEEEEVAVESATIAINLVILLASAQIRAVAAEVVEVVEVVEDILARHHAVVVTLPRHPDEAGATRHPEGAEAIRDRLLEGA